MRWPMLLQSEQISVTEVLVDLKGLLELVTDFGGLSDGALVGATGAGLGGEVVLATAMGLLDDSGMGGLECSFLRPSFSLMPATGGPGLGRRFGNKNNPTSNDKEARTRKRLEDTSMLLVGSLPLSSAASPVMVTDTWASSLARSGIVRALGLSLFTCSRALRCQECDWVVAGTTSPSI